MIGAGEEEDDGGLTPTEDEGDVQRLSGPPESVSALVNRGYAKNLQADAFFGKSLYHFPENCAILVELNKYYGKGTPNIWNRIRS